MSDRCHIIRDMLPLYLDGMLSEDLSLIHI